MSRGETLALIGELGSRKSTLLRIAAGLMPQAQAQVALDGIPLDRDASHRPLEARRRIQIIFQNPDRSLNVQKRVGENFGAAAGFVFRPERAGTR